MKRIATLVVGLAILWPAAAAAAAQSGSTCQAYNPQSCGVSGIATSGSGGGIASSGSGGAPATSGYIGSGSTGTLPFTGFEIALIVAGGFGLLGAGLVVRRVSRLS